MAKRTQIAFAIIALMFIGGCAPEVERPTLDINSSYRFVVAGSNYSIALLQNGDLLAWGGNEHGQLGDGTTISKSHPVPVGSGNYHRVAAGYYHSLALAPGSDFRSVLWAWGNNDRGQLGIGSNVSMPLPTMVGKWYDEVAAGGFHTLALKGDELWAWGANESGQLGDGTFDDKNYPVLIGKGYYKIAAGFAHSLALKSNGALWAWGLNDHGQLGDGTFLNRESPVMIDTGFSYIAAGKSHSLAKRRMDLFAWGANEHGQLGDGTFIDSNMPKYITGSLTFPTGPLTYPKAGGDCSIGVGIAVSGLIPNFYHYLFLWGANDSGQIGYGSMEDRNSPTKLNPAFDIASFGEACSTSGRHSLAVKIDGTLWAWGSNEFGQLGNGTLQSVSKPVQIIR